MRRAELAVDAVGGDDEIEVHQHLAVRLDLGLEAHHHAELAGARLQNLEQPLAADADEAVAARGDLRAVHMHVDVVPMRELVDHAARAYGVVGLEVLHRLVGEDDAPAERVARPVALEHHDLGIGRAQLHRDREIEPSRARADAGDLHGNGLEATMQYMF